MTKRENNLSLNQNPDDLYFQLMLAEIVMRLSNSCEVKKQSVELRRLAARYGNAHFFYSENGDFRLLVE